MRALDAVRADFPALRTTVRGEPLVYLDSASTAQKPQVVLDATRAAYTEACANVHRGVHTLSARATDAYEAARDKVARFLGASDRREVVFTHGTTASLNLLASSLGAGLGPADEVVVTALEHHSNLVPWQLVCKARRAKLTAIPLDATGTVTVEAVAERLSPRVRIVAISHVSNALGSILPVREIASLAAGVGAVTVVDGAQAVPHLPVDVAELGCDFYALSSHKLFGPTGVGVLWGRRELLDELPPWQGGGEMIADVALDRSTFREAPYRFEAGTPNIAGVIGLGAAIDYVAALGYDAITTHESELLRYAIDRLAAEPAVRLIGTAESRVAVVSFAFGDVHAHDVGTVLDGCGIAVRTGHHCAQPAVEHFGVDATVRASFAVYNTRDDVDRLLAGLAEVREVFG